MMAKIEPIAPYLEPVRKTATVHRTVEDAFHLFTQGMADWWPKDRYSVSQERTREVVLEPRVGGSVYEVRDDGRTFPWGTVKVWEPPTRLIMSWHPGRGPEVAQEVEIRFEAVKNGTRVDLEHRDWSRLGADAAEARERYDGGWTEVLGKYFVDACANE